MRTLTIKRTKSFVGCLAKMKIYIEDPTSQDLTIHHVPCRKIGTIKNGEEVSFEIGEQAMKIFVIADKFSRNYCNEFYQLTEGSEDVFLSGKNQFNPAVGNAFRFDNNDNAEVITNRKKGLHIGILIMILSVVIGFIVGFSLNTDMFSNDAPVPKTFSTNEIQITLTDEFRESNVKNYTVAYDSRDVAVFALKEEYVSAPGLSEYTTAQYADLIIQANELQATKIQTENGVTRFEYNYTNPDTDDWYRFFIYVYKTDDAFWSVQFATLNQNVNHYAPQIAQWANSVTFL